MLAERVRRLVLHFLYLMVTLLATVTVTVTVTVMKMHEGHGHDDAMMSTYVQEHARLRKHECL